MRIHTAALIVCLAQAAPQPARSSKLERVASIDVQLTPDSVVVIPLGAGLQPHGSHLSLGTDLTLAEHLAHRVMEATPVVVAPPLTYHFVAETVEQPGSATLTLETARDATIQVARSLARSGARRFYVVNTSATASRALNAAAGVLARDGILLRFTDFAAQVGAHAKEAETSMLLHIDPPSVNMDRAGGDATGAAAGRGKVFLDTLVAALVRDVEGVRRMTLPEPHPEQETTRALPPPVPNVAQTRLPSKCTQGDERAITALATAFTAFWTQGDPDKIGALWSDEGDLVHPDGAVERGRATIRQNRREQFTRKEYRSSRHAVAFGVLRCLSDEVAVADGKWTLTGVYDAAGNILPRGEGLVTVVLKKSGGGWLFEAYRYTVTQQGAKPPTLLKKPGYPDKY